MRGHHLLREAQAAGIRLGLERVRALLTSLGEPQRAVPVVHVTGTNGKGSVSAMCASIGASAGLRSGLYLSPHLQELNERVQQDGALISDAALRAALDRVEGACAAWAAAHGPVEGPVLTCFEALTVAAFDHFARSRPDLTVIEVGLGGRLDATNVVTPEVSVITSVGLDHTERLGQDTASIAAEKAGILKPGVPAVVGRLDREAMAVVRSMAATQGCPLRVLDQDFALREEPGGGLVFSSSERCIAELYIPLEGRFQRDNTAIAVAAMVALGARRPELAASNEAVRAGLARVRHPGRMEWLAEDVLADGAHNAAGAQALAAALAERPRDRDRVLLLGASRDKDVRAIAAALAPQVDRVYTTACAHPRAMAPGEVARALVDLHLPVTPAGPLVEALPLARERGGLVVVAGSLYLVGATRDLLGLPAAGAHLT